MKVVLLNPPGFFAFTPPLGILSLAGYLRKHGIEVMIIDVSIEALHYVLKPERVSSKFRLAMEILNKGNHNIPPLQVDLFKSAEKYTKIMEKTLNKTWREDSFLLDKGKFDVLIKAIEGALLYSSVCHFPSMMSVYGCNSESEMIQKEEQNPFLEFYREVIIPKIREFQPDLIGVSYSYSEQAVHGVSMTYEILKTLNLPVVAGGSFISIHFEQILMDKSRSLPLQSDASEFLIPFLYPYAIQGEGEAPILELARCIKEQTSVDHIPGLIFVDRKNGIIKANSPAAPLKGEELPVINLEGLPIGKKYLSPVPAAPLMTSRGCYWNKCAFCAHASVIDSRWREVPPSTIIENIKLYSKKYGVKYIFFCDEAISPRMLKELSVELPKQNIKVFFGSMARFEKGLIDLIKPASKAGLKLLSFGFESGCKRVVDKMNKGYSHDNAQEIIDECYRNKVSVDLNVMLGFPTETRSEAFETIEFIEKNISKVDMLHFNAWNMVIGSDVYNNMEEYGVYIKGDKFIPGDFSTYGVRDGISYEEAEEIIFEIQNNPRISKKIISNESFLSALKI